MTDAVQHSAWKGAAMQFRWIALIAVWTILIGPVLGPPQSGSQLPTEKQHYPSSLSAKKR
jgi:hypothetical protein